MNHLNYKHLFLFSLLITACGGGDSANPAARCENFSLPMASLTGPAITIHMNMAGLPATLPTNMPHTQDFHTEYYWIVSFDVDGNSIPGDGDLEVQLSQSKIAELSQTTCKLTEMHAAVFRYSSATLVQITGAGVSVSGNTITLKVAKSQHPALANITSQTQVQFSTLGYDITGQGRTENHLLSGEHFPEVGYIDTNGGALLVDTRMGLSALFGVNVDHHDLQSLQVIID